MCDFGYISEIIRKENDYIKTMVGKLQYGICRIGLERYSREEEATNMRSNRDNNHSSIDILREKDKYNSTNCYRNKKKIRRNYDLEESLLSGGFDEVMRDCDRNTFFCLCCAVVDVRGLCGKNLANIKSYIRSYDCDNCEMRVSFNSVKKGYANDLCDTIIALTKTLDDRYVFQLPQAASRCRDFMEFIGNDVSKMVVQKGHKDWITTLPHSFLKVKYHAGATSKVNVTFYGVMKGIQINYPRVYELIRSYGGLIHNLSDDQGAAVALYTCGVYDLYKEKAIIFALLPFVDIKMSKDLSSLLKASGMNSCLHGAVVCELQTLLGRGVFEIDAVEEAYKRCYKSCIPDTGINDDDLRCAIKSIISDELGKCEFEENAEFWSKRWLWCANGAHNRMIERINPKYKVKQTRRLYRKVAAECWKDDVVEGWDGEVVVTPSQKLEHGKSRLLLACDTVSYMAFEHMLSGVEKAWKGQRVILDPGSMSSYDIRDFCWKGKSADTICMAMDYDDFNSQHTLKAQKMVIEETVMLSNYDKRRGKMLVDSFDNMWVHSGVASRKRIVGTLLSGHRGTTYLNSVLNAAYIKCAVGNLWKDFRSIHIGDDVMIVVEKKMMADLIVERIYNTKLLLNPTKQSIGRESAELLRIAHGVHGESFGYLARAVSSAVSGNWVSEKILTMKERITSCITTTWTLMNRCGGTESCAKVLAYNIAKRCEISHDDAIALCTGSVAINGGPLRKVTGSRVCSFTVVDALKEGDEFVKSDLPTHATDRYIEMELTNLERYLYEYKSDAVKAAMKTSSYRKAVCVAGEVLPSTIIKEVVDVPIKCVDCKHLLRQSRKHGILEAHPIIYLLRDHLNSWDVKSLMEKCGVTVYTDEDVWGQKARPCIIQRPMLFSEAAEACKHGCSTVLNCDVSIYA